MKKQRTSIPPELRRQARQKCNFSCVLCGCPIYDVDHIDDWALVKEHTLDNLTLLCPMHHRLKTNRILSKEIVRERTNAIKHKNTYNKPDLHFRDCHLVLGNNVVWSCPSVCFAIRWKDYFQLGYDEEYGVMRIDAALYDNNGNIAFKVEDSIYTVNTEFWDVEFVGNRIIFRTTPAEETLQIRLDGPHNTVQLSGRIYFGRDKFINIDENGLSCNGKTLMSECEISLCGIGIAIAEPEYFKNVVTAFGGTNNFRNIATYCQVGYGCTFNILEQLYRQ